jgi:hypothetical protein
MIDPPQAHITEPLRDQNEAAPQRDCNQRGPDSGFTGVYNGIAVREGSHNPYASMHGCLYIETE